MRNEFSEKRGVCNEEESEKHEGNRMRKEDERVLE